MYDFNNIANRDIDRSRKWNHKLLKEKYPNIHNDVIPMWIADMDFRVAPEIIDEFSKIVLNGAFGYTSVKEDFAEAIKDWYSRRHKVNINDEWVRLTYGTVATIHNLYQAFCQPNESILIFTPVYDPFRYAAENNGLNLIYSYLEIADNRYFINFNKLEQQLKNERPKILLLCSPHNPSGRIWSIEELNNIAYLCKKYDVLLVSDEVHSEITFDRPFNSALKIDEKYLINLIVLSSPNKAFNLGGLKTSYAVIPNERLRVIFYHRLQMNSVTSPNTFGAIGLITAYNESEGWLNELNKYLYNNYEYTKEFIHNELPFWKLMEMESSYLPWINIEETGLNSDELVEKIANNTGVVLEPGTNYAKGGDNFIRLNLGTSFELVKESLNRISKLKK